MLTNNQVAGLRAKPAAYTLSDKHPEIKPGSLALRVRPLHNDKTNKGSKSWLFIYSIKDPATGKRQKKRIVIGSYPALSLAQARGKAKAHAAELVSGIDPQEARQEQGEDAQREAQQGTLADICDSYLHGLECRSKSTGRGATSAKSIKSLFGYVHRHNAATRLAKEITPNDISAVLGTCSARTAQQRLRQALHAAFNDALRRQYDPNHTATTGKTFGLVGNPVSVVKIDALHVAKEQKRCLSGDELVAVWQHLRDSDTNPVVYAFVRLCLLTGQRPGDIRHIPWECYHDAHKRIEIPANLTKNGRPHLICLAPMARQVVKDLHSITGDQEYLFAGRRGRGGWTGAPVRAETISHTMPRIAAAAEVESFNLKGDLRRSWKTIAGRAGLSLELRNRIQNHAFSDIGSRVYDLHDYAKEMAGGMGKFERHFKKLLQEERDNVVQLHG